MASESIERIEVNAEELAGLLQVEPRTVYRFAKAEGMPRAGRGRYPLAVCIRWYFDRISGQHSAQAVDPVKEDRRRLYRAQAAKAELENRMRRGELVEIDAMDAAYMAFAGAVGSQLEALAHKVAARLAALTDPREIARVLQDECRVIRNSAAAAARDIASDLQSGDDDRAAAGSDGGRLGGGEPDTTG